MAESRDSLASVASLERDVKARSATLKKELGLFDLVLTQVVFVVGTIWVGWAAKLGYQQNVFWILAIITFYLPLAAVVIFLNRLLPLEGGLYQWAKAAFGDLIAFMVAWNLWVFAILIASGIGLVVTTNISYSIGDSAGWMRSAKWLITVVSCLLVFGLIAAAVRGLGVGKWIHNAGGAALMITFAVLLALPLIASHPNEYRPFAVQVPTLSMMNVNVYSKLALGALTGFEYIAILAGETRAPARTIGRSVIISAPIIAVMYILGTRSVLALVSPANVGLNGPIPQVLSIGFRSYGWVDEIDVGRRDECQRSEEQ